jgi:hypothetical protein
MARQKVERRKSKNVATEPASATLPWQDATLIPPAGSWQNCHTWRRSEARSRPVWSEVRMIGLIQDHPMTDSLDIPDDASANQLVRS